MMAIDVTVTQTIDASLATMSRPSCWTIATTRRGSAASRVPSSLGDPPLRVGSDVRRVASFMGKRIEYVNRVESLQPAGSCTCDRSSTVPHAGHYAFDDHDGPRSPRSACRVSPPRCTRSPDPCWSVRCRRSVTADLRPSRPSWSGVRRPPDAARLAAFVPEVCVAQPCAAMFFSTISIVFASSAVGWNSTTSVPAKSSGV